MLFDMLIHGIILDELNLHIIKIQKRLMIYYRVNS